ncbi:S1/P1 nuclease [Saliniradius amylolyticus]|nr:S1/P1 nuclease [Saliniradius amylolyticus]
MRKPAFAAAALIAAAINYSPDANAWGQTGHRITGAIAEQYLTSEAKAAIDRILGPEDLAEASTWPDEMRSHPSEFWQETASPYHYVTVPEGKHYHQVGAPEQGDAYTALEGFSKTLQDEEASLEERQLALRFIVHIIGDLHQPLHAGNGTDRGGNDVKLSFFWENSNLHRVWDSGLIDRQQLSYSEWTSWLNRRITAEEVADWQSAPPLQWIEESTDIRDVIYPDSDAISWDYKFKHLPKVKMRLKQAGVRMAAYLNQLFAQ